MKILSYTFFGTGKYGVICILVDHLFEVPSQAVQEVAETAQASGGGQPGDLPPL